MAKNLEIPFLLDFYGEMLTEKQYECLVYYYEDDLSLSEIAENEGITRQGVRDSIKRAEAQLFDMEERLGLAKKFTEMKKGIDEIIECADNINEYNLSHSLSMEINDNVARIKTLASFLKEG
ncbi:MAG: YlxM family DNA-binding protein [Eubacteriales bacterium]|nr:YlxM family DNA-binding protein [Eubacteriales bacterium]